MKFNCFLSSLNSIFKEIFLNFLCYFIDVVTKKSLLSILNFVLEKKVKTLIKHLNLYYLIKSIFLHLKI